MRPKPFRRDTSRRRSGPPPAARVLRRERAWVVLLLALHAALAGWGVARNSVTFDENFHLPAGIMIVTRGDYTVSVAQPPLVKVLCALPALAMGARLPLAPPSSELNNEATVGESFMRRNAARFHTLYAAARLVIVALSVLLAMLVWTWSRRLYGPRGALLSLALYALAPEALAHGGVVGMDLATGLAFTAVLMAFWRACRGGRAVWGALAVLAVVAAFLTRFSAVELVPVLVALALWGTLAGRLRRAGRVWLALLACVPAVWLALAVAYRGELWLAPLGRAPFESESFRHLARLGPGLRLPLPRAYLIGLDYVASLSRAGAIPTYLLGQIRHGRVWSYFPLALAFKWPLAFLLALALRAATWMVRPPSPRRRWHEAFMLLPALVMLAAAMAAGSLNVGIRYLFPLVPLLCVWCGGLLARSRAGSAAWRSVAAGLVLLQAIETGLAAPYYLSFFNWPAGGPGGGDRLVNDSNVDWGQGLIGLRDELRRRGIGRIHLAYHGTTDPAVYGIDYLPYLGGRPGPESEWLAVSSYWFVGLSQRMMTPRGRTDFMRIDFSPLWNQPWVAHPAGCMYLFRIPHATGIEAPPIAR